MISGLFLFLLLGWCDLICAFSKPQEPVIFGTYSEELTKMEQCKNLGGTSLVLYKFNEASSLVEAIKIDCKIYE